MSLRTAKIGKLLSLFVFLKELKPIHSPQRGNLKLSRASTADDVSPRVDFLLYASNDIGEGWETLQLTRHRFLHICIIFTSDWPVFSTILTHYTEQLLNQTELPPHSAKGSRKG